MAEYPALLGRIPQYDERNLAHLMSKALARRTVERPARKVWGTDWVGDQNDEPPDAYGEKGYCVGYAWAGLRHATPTKRLRPAPMAIYDGAQRLDAWPGEAYSGTSVLGGAAYLMSRDLLVEYLWAYTVTDVCDWLAVKGPVVLGTNWYNRMFYPQTLDGVPNSLRVGGPYAGGHAYLCVGYDDEVRSVRIVNSWGRGWGADGRAWLPYDGLQRLLDEQGEACTAVERKATTTTTAPKPKAVAKAKPKPRTTAKRKAVTRKVTAKRKAKR